VALCGPISPSHVSLSVRRAKSPGRTSRRSTARPPHYEANMNKDKGKMDQRIKHGMKGTPEYIAWNSMVQRTTNPKSASYRRYGGRGITVCDRWRYGEDGKHGVECFYADMGDKPSNGHSLDRINNELGYFPANCQWATWPVQYRNRRPNNTPRSPSIIPSKLAKRLREVLDLTAR
jgi:hypothetical protein